MENAKRIIVIEDEKDINNLIAYNLRREGFSVEQVFDGLDARERLSHEQFNIVILDIMLPGLDGFCICKAIKDDPANFKTFVVIVSAKTGLQDKLYGNLLGADYYLSKPFSVTKLTEIVKELAIMRDKKYLVREVTCPRSLAR